MNRTRIHPLTPYWQKVLDAGLAKSLSKLAFAPLIANRDTAFVLGTGASVNELTAEQEQAIEAGFSIGMNGWPAHPRIKGSVLLHEAAGEPEMRRYAEVLERRYSGTGTMPALIIKDGWATDYDFSILPEWVRQRSYLSYEQFIYGTTEKDFFHTFSELRITEKFGRVLWPQVAVVPSRKTSVVWALCLCILLRFKRIVLVGIDCAGGYFYDPSDAPAASPHYVADPRYGEPTLPTILKGLIRGYTKPAGIRLECWSSRSPLKSLCEEE